MLSIRTPESPLGLELDSQSRPSSQAASPQGRKPIDIAPVEESLRPAQSSEPIEYEIVLGRRQVASVAFVVIVLLAVVSAAAYMAGKALAPATLASATQAGDPPDSSSASATPAPPKIDPPAPATPVINATIAPPEIPVEKVPVSKSDAQSAAPLFAEPVSGAVYIQIGAVEKGIAVLLAEGLRTHGMDSFVAPGPNERIFRVLVGPLPNPGSFTRAKETVDLLGLSTFARRYQK